MFIKKYGRIDSVILFMQKYEHLNAYHANLSLGESQTQFESTHKAWLAKQNLRFETHGVWCDDIRNW